MVQLNVVAFFPGGRRQRQKLPGGSWARLVDRLMNRRTYFKQSRRQEPTPEVIL